MTGFFSPNYAVLPTWKSAISVAFQQLRRVRFAVDSTFEWSDFDPQVDYDGAAHTAQVILASRYLLVNKILFFSLDIQATLAAPLSTRVRVTLPRNKTAGGTSSALQCGGTVGVDGGATVEVGSWQIIAGESHLDFRRPGNIAFTAGFFRGIANGFIEVM